MGVERQSAIGFSGLGNCDRRARLVIGGLTMRRHDAEAVDGTAQQDYDQAFRAVFGSGCPAARADPKQRQTGGLEKITPQHSSYRRMKSGLPRISAARSGGGAPLIASRVSAAMAGASIASNRPTSTAPLACPTGRAPRASAV